ncbi:MAG: class I SAM-dependent methyltransferase [Thermoanaerobaculia bacterium]
MELSKVGNAPENLDGYFYHSIELPGRPAIAGAWDLRAHVDEYLGSVDLARKRILEVGAANGFLTFTMERRGARVVPYDLSPDHLGDIMKIPGRDYSEFEEGYRKVVAGLNKAWWYARNAFGSSLELTHGTAYDLRDVIGEVDVTLFGSILLHLRDPYSALKEAGRVTRERIIVTDTHNPPFTDETIPRDHELRSGILFDPSRGKDPCTWWYLSPGSIQRMLASLGFARSEVTFHTQIFRPGFSPWGATAVDSYRGPEIVGSLFTVVADRS